MDNEDVRLALAIVRDEVGNLVIRLCSALSDKAYLQEQNATLKDHLVKLAAKVAELERELTAERGKE